MSSLRDTIVTWVDERIEEMLARPRMWGSAEAVEMQVLQLLEFRALALHPAQEVENPRRVIDAYVAFLRERFPSAPPQPLFQLAGADETGTALTGVLREFQKALAPTMLEENPFLHGDVVLRLTFDEGKPPTTSAFTGYYEEFRRAARAVARPREGAAVQALHRIEAATDFALTDTRVIAANGAPAQVLLLLGAGSGPRDHAAEEQVRDALTNIVTMAEWAGSSASIAELPVDDAEERTRVAVQALRILPRRGIALVGVGGRLIGRAKPVELRAAQEARFVEVLGAGTVAEDFDERDEVRAIDLDQGLLVLGKARTPCYVRADLLGEVAAVGVEARVVGKRYRPLGGRAFVVAEGVEVRARDADGSLPAPHS